MERQLRRDHPQRGMLQGVAVEADLREGVPGGRRVRRRQEARGWRPSAGFIAFEISVVPILSGRHHVDLAGAAESEIAERPTRIRPAQQITDQGQQVAKHVLNRAYIAVTAVLRADGPSTWRPAAQIGVAEGGLRSLMVLLLVWLDCR